eukprot:scaffold5195_cov164-Skeletonema_dohrnii-CCMP3373.AAC.2
MGYQECPDVMLLQPTEAEIWGRGLKWGSSRKDGTPSPLAPSTTQHGVSIPVPDIGETATNK